GWGAPSQQASTLRRHRSHQRPLWCQIRLPSHAGHACTGRVSQRGRTPGPPGPGVAAALRPGLAVLVGVGQEAHGAGSLHGVGQEPLLDLRQAGDAARADLPALADEPAERREVLPVQLLRREAGPALALSGRRRPAALLRALLPSWLRHLLLVVVSRGKPAPDRSGSVGAGAPSAR